MIPYGRIIINPNRTAKRDQATPAPTIPNRPCYDGHAKASLSQRVQAFYRQAAKELPQLVFTTTFSPGRPDTWGETLTKITGAGGQAIAEALNGSLIRTAAGRTRRVETLDDFVSTIRRAVG